MIGARSLNRRTARILVVGKLVVAGVLFALASGLAGNAFAQTIQSIASIYPGPTGNGQSGLGYTTTGTVTQIVSVPGAVNGIGGTGSSVVYTYAYFISDGTSSIDIYGSPTSGSPYVPTVGDTIEVTGNYAPFNRIPELAPKTITKLSSNNPIPASALIYSGTNTTTIPYVTADIAASNPTGQLGQQGSVSLSGGTGTVLPLDLGAVMVTFDYVTISGAGAPGATFGTVNSPTTPAAKMTDLNGNSMVFYYWPTSYSVSNTNLANVKIPGGLVDMTGFMEAYGASQIPEFNPISVTPVLGPPVYWQPSAGSSTWDGSTLSFSASSGQQVNLVGNVGSNNATFDDTGLVNGSTVNVPTAVNALSLSVTNTGGTYTFTGPGSVTAGTVSKTGSGALVINTALNATVSITAGTLGGNGTILGPVTVGSGATLTPGATVSTVGQMTMVYSSTAGPFFNVDFSSGGTYLWKLGSSLVDNSSGTAGTNWDLLNMTQAGNLNFGGSAQLALSFAGSANPNSGNAFWNNNHTWVIASGDTAYATLISQYAPIVGGSILGNSYSSGTFSLQGDTSSDLVLKFTSVLKQARNLFWSANGSGGLADGAGAWSSADWANQSSGGTGALSFDSTRPDNATFGNPGGSGGSYNVSVGGAVTVGMLTFDGSNSANYALTSANASSVLTINGGITALGSGTLGNKTPSLGLGEIYLGYSQTWNVASGTLLVQERGQIYQSTVAGLTKTGSGVLNMLSKCNYTGGTTLDAGRMYMGGANYLPPAGLVTIAPGAFLEFSGNAQQIGGLSGSGGSIDLGSGGGLEFGDATNQTFSGVISGSGYLEYVGQGTSVLAGSNTFVGSVSILSQAGGGGLQVSADNNLGDPSNGVTIDNANLLGATASFSSSRTITIGTNNGTLDVVGSGTVLTVNGQVTGAGTLTVNNASPVVGSPLPGTLVLTNSTNNYAATVLSDGTLSISSSSAVGTGLISFLGNKDGSTMTFTNSMTLSNDLYFPVVGQKAIWFDTLGNTVTLTGQLWPDNMTETSVAIDKSGSGTLNLAAGDTTNLGTKGPMYVNQGTVELSGVGSDHYSALGNADITVSAGAAVRLANVQLGYANDTTNGAPLGYLQLDSGTASVTTGATLIASGSSSYTAGDVIAALNYNPNNLQLVGTATAPAYEPGTVYIQTVNASDVLSIPSSVKQYDAGAGGGGVSNNYGNAVYSASTGRYVSDPAKLVTIQVSGPGMVQLQGGGNTSDATFGGAWSVQSGVLQVGPYTQSFDNGSSDYYSGPAGQLLNALGFKTLNGQTPTPSNPVQGDPDIPNGVTVNSGGVLAVAVDQVNLNQSLNYSESTANPTPSYLRNPITLSGGTLAATGYEMTFNVGVGDAPFGLGGGSLNSTPVTAKLGGDFIVSAGTSTIDTYDPVGNTGVRTVQLLGGSRLLSNSTAAYAAGTTLTYNTIWDGTLNVNGGTAGGGQFDLMRDSGGSVSVAPGAEINIVNGASVKLLNLTTDLEYSDPGTQYQTSQSEEPSGAVSDPFGGLYDSGSGRSVNITGSKGSNLVFSRSAALTYNGNISGGMDVTQSGSDDVVLGGDNTYTGGTTISSGTLTLDSQEALEEGSSLTVGNASGIMLGYTPEFHSTTVAVPEPGTLALLAAGAVAVMVYRKRCSVKRIGGQALGAGSTE